MNLFQRVERNTTGRDLIVGDVHGHFGKLRASLDAVGFDPARGDRLFSVGDLVDLGPESDDVLAWLGKPWFRAVCGNHEDMAMLWNEGGISAEDYVRNGGAWNVANPKDQREILASAFAALPLVIELDTVNGPVGIVHAGCPAPHWGDFTHVLRQVDEGAVSLSDPVVQALMAWCMWSRERIEQQDESEVAGVVAVVVGHTPVESLSRLGNTVFLDTGAWLPRRAAEPFVIIDAATLAPALPALAMAG